MDVDALPVEQKTGSSDWQTEPVSGVLGIMSFEVNCVTRQVNTLMRDPGKPLEPPTGRPFRGREQKAFPIFMNVF